jgi:hypothetical protein
VIGQKLEQAGATRQAGGSDKRTSVPDKEPLLRPPMAAPLSAIACGTPPMSSPPRASCLCFRTSSWPVAFALEDDVFRQDPLKGVDVGTLVPEELREAAFRGDTNGRLMARTAGGDLSLHQVSAFGSGLDAHLCGRVLSAPGRPPSGLEVWRASRAAAFRPGSRSTAISPIREA